MSKQNVETVRRGIDAFNRRDFDAALALHREDVTWERFLSRTEADSPLVRGRENLRVVWESQVEAIDIRVEPDEFIAVGDHKVVVPMRVLAQGRGSEISLTAAITWVWTFDGDGLGANVEVFDSREEALEAAGRGDQTRPEGNLEVVRLAHQHLNDGNLEGLIALCDVEFELDMTARVLNPETYRGHEGIRRFYRDVGEVWGEFRWERLRMFEGADKVVVLYVFHGRGRGSGLRVTRDGAMVWTVRGGHALALDFYTDQADALEAAGLRE